MVEIFIRRPIATALLALGLALAGLGAMLLLPVAFSEVPSTAARSAGTTGRAAFRNSASIFLRISVSPWARSFAPMRAKSAD